MYSDVELVLQISDIEYAIYAKQEHLFQSEDFDEMCILINEISDLGGRLMECNIKLCQGSPFHFPRIPEY
ncbi:hypothetical protein HQN89_04910 [Paenibacillus frigoriresistens]|uniref:hypothetical protein n=1 Tax=Paenibacillus alginolyticus TaxID=59839 RepID=UPI00156698F4|nr:hypothetical protein [Paenibacillus frigoriresistens]NRF90375.1 hypothetical protein [Paenibacillus frigoriresistens]